MIDATLTDLGRQKLSQGDGSFFPTRFRVADDEIDYRFWNELTGSDSKDRAILDTPVLEACTNEVVALKYPLVTIRNNRLQYMAALTSKPSSVSLREQVDSVGGGADIVVYQDTPRAQTVIPPEMVDTNYTVELDNDVLQIAGERPTSITSFGTATYVIPATPSRQTAAGGTECRFNLRVQTLTTELFDVTAGVSAAKPRSFSANVNVRGQQSGLYLSIPVTITEFATS
jgi:hypothetical protein